MVHRELFVMVSFERFETQPLMPDYLPLDPQSSRLWGGSAEMDDARDGCHLPINRVRP